MTMQQVLCRPRGDSFDNPGYFKAKKKGMKSVLAGKRTEKRVNLHEGVKKKEKALTLNRSSVTMLVTSNSSA